MPSEFPGDPPGALTQESSYPAALTAAVFVDEESRAGWLREACVHAGLTLLALDLHTLGTAQAASADMLIVDEHARASLVARCRQESCDVAPGKGLPALICVRPTKSDLEPGGMLTLADDPAHARVQLCAYAGAFRAAADRQHALREQQELNQRIFSSVTNGISIADARLPDMPLIYVNPSFEKMTGYTAAEVQGRNCRFLQGEDRDQPGLAVIRDAIAAGREAVVLLKNYRKDGSPFWNELSMSPIRNARGEITHFVGIQSDVTVRIDFEMALRESEKLAAVGRMAASIAHEINNPLSAVMNLVFLAQSRPMDSQAREYLRNADEELQRVSLITAQSLRFYRQSNQPQHVSTSNLLTSVLEVHRRHFYHADVTIERRDRTMASIPCLESEIRQVLSNLVRNAIDAMRDKGGRLLVRSRQARQWCTGIPGVVITIADTGEGIHQDALNKIYTAFFSTKGSKGTGLGLWVSAEIVKRHKGHLRVRSRRDHRQSGTVFQLFLPFQERQEAA